MMRFRGSSRGYNRRRPGDCRSVNRIDLPDFIPFERLDHSHHAQHIREPNNRMSSPFQHNRKGSRGNSEDRYLSRRESSASMERQKRKHSPITHHQSSSQPKKYRSKSPVNLKVTARVRNTSHNGSFSADYDNNNFPRLHDDSRPKRSPIIFDLDDPRRNQHSMNESKGHSLPHEGSMRVKKSPSDDELDIADRLKTLERDKKQLVVHCNGLRDTIDQYYREVSKLESLIYTWSEEIDILKRRYITLGMAFLYNIGDWFNLGHQNAYRKIELYSMDFPEDINLEHMKVYASSFGGPIAITKDPNQLRKTGSSVKPVIYIFSSSGNLISKINWNSGVLLTMGWSDSEELLCVQENGIVLIYDLFGEFLHKFSMGQEATDTQIIDAKIYASTQGTGIAVMTTQFRIFIANNYKDPKVRLLPEIPKSLLDPSSWTILIEDRKTTCLIAREQELFKVKQDENICSAVIFSLDSDYKAIRFISVSFNNRHVAMCTNTGFLWMGSSDLRTKYCEFNSGRMEVPKQIEWVIDSDDPLKAEALVITYNSFLLIVGTNGESNIYPYNDPAIFLIPEMDGVRVLTNGYHEFIQKVPKSVSNIFGISISEPSSFLFESHRKFVERSHQSDEYLCLIMDKIDLAVEECIKAAGYEFDTETQKSLISAAHFGKGFINGHNPDEYIRICKILRVLNAIRSDDIGIPLTINQFLHLTPAVLIDRLVFRKHYGLAIQISKHLNLSESRIMEHWAYHKIMYDKNDTEIIQKIAEKFANAVNLGLSFCTIAKKAEEIGKTKLAIELLEMEPNQSLKVPLLLKLGENRKALIAATQSGDSDLIYMVLMQLKDTTPLSKFQMIIREFPLAQNLYKKYCLLNNITALKDIYLQEDDFLAQAEMSLDEALDSHVKLDSSLLEISSNYKKAHKELEAELSDDHRKLMKQQKSFEEKYSRPFYGLSLHDTVKELLVIGDIKLAEKIRTEHKMTDKHFWHLRIRILGGNFQWEELEKFSKSKKSPVSYEPFVEVCLKARNVNEAKKYISKCREDKRIIWYNRAGLYEESAKLAFELRDTQSLLHIHSLVSATNDNNLVSKIENLIAAMSSKK